MTANSTSSASSAAVIDALNALLEAEENSVFRFMGDSSPYLSRASAEIRNPLNEMVRAGDRHVMDLAGLIDRLGGVPLPRGIQPEEQYLAFLTLKFLLPKLLEAKQLTIQRYENTLRALHNAPPEVTDLLKAHLAEHREHADILRRAFK
jgi:bacterioferritin (cytochrome b1)